MNLNDNPIFLTQKRLVHRSGVLAAILIAALIGASLVSGLIAYLAAPGNFDFKSVQEAGKIFYGWVIGVEILVLVIGGFSRITAVLVNERKAGLWDSNRLTPLSPRQLVTGYWFGSPLREVYMAAILAGIGLVLVLVAKLSILLWLGTQILIVSTALFFGLLAVLVGLSMQRAQGGIIFIAAIFFLQFPSFGMPKLLLTNFLLPIYGIVNLFIDAPISNNSYDPMRDWWGYPEMFGVSIYPVLLSLILQLVIGVFLWRSAIRKTANPFQAPLLRWEAAILFAIMLAVQHGLVWGIWRGHFPDINGSARDHYLYEPLLPIIHGGTMLLMILVLASMSPQPETVRVKALRLRITEPGAIFPDSAAALALELTGIAALLLLMQCALSLAATWKAYVIAAGNLLDVALIFSLLLEFCRLRFRRRALGFVALWLFILCVLPFILAGVFTNGAIGRLSLLSPGILALSDPNSDDLNYLFGIVAGHFGIVVILFLGWQRQWKRLLSRVA